MMDLKEIKAGAREDLFWHKAAAELIPILIAKTGLKNPRILDVGCGAGEHIKMLKAHGEVWLNDIDRETLDFIKDIPAERKICKDFTKITLKDKFDLITMLGSLEHIKDDRKAVEVADHIFGE